MTGRLPLSAGRFLRALALLCWLALPAWAAELDGMVAAVPNPRAIDRTWVADPAGAIRAGKDEIDALIGGFEQETGVEIAVVVLPSIGELNPKEFATALFKHWGIGKKGKDNGVLVLQVLDQRRIEIETGYGLEGSLPDVKCHWVIEDIAIPFFKAGSFSDCHYELVAALIAGIRNPDADRRQLGGGIQRAPGDRVDPPASDYRLPSAAPAQGMPWTQPDVRDLAPVFLALSPAPFLAYAFLARRHRLGHPDPYAQWNYVRQQSWLVYAGMVLVVLACGFWEWLDNASLWSIQGLAPGGFLSHGYIRRRQRWLRDRPRLDPDTGEAMRRLDEKAEDAFLQAGQICEEQIHSVDYDVWLSPSGHVRIDRYDGPAEAESCPACGYRTFRLTSTRTVQLATQYADGRAEDTYACTYCRHARVVARRLEQLLDSSSSGSGSYSSSDGGSSSGGGSFGGGSSGGGGAGGSY